MFTFIVFATLLNIFCKGETDFTDLIVYKGNSMTLTCKSDGDELMLYFRNVKTDNSPSMIYGKDGINLEFINKFNITNTVKNGRKETNLYIKNITTLDAGTYWCYTDSEWRQANVHVISEPQICTGICANDQVYLKCAINYMSRKKLYIQWLYKDVVIDQSCQQEIEEPNNINLVTFSIQNHQCRNDTTFKTRIYEPTRNVYSIPQNEFITMA